MGRKEREGDALSMKINTYSCNFITDGYVGSIAIRVCSWPRNVHDRADITRVILSERGTDRARRHQGDPAEIFGRRV